MPLANDRFREICTCSRNDGSWPGSGHDADLTDESHFPARHPTANFNEDFAAGFGIFAMNRGAAREVFLAARSEQGTELAAEPSSYPNV